MAGSDSIPSTKRLFFEIFDISGNKSVQSHTSVSHCSLTRSKQSSIHSHCQQNQSESSLLSSTNNIMNNEL